ncbi:CPBP family intramembrane metalloprotease [Pseudomonas sp. S75]|uniref:CPBP family intramembrane glutamic endopeptidase n=1 Tax=unclassified Pseudomonas TaxID=196821 RepID=UPI001908A688|nr:MULTISPECIES: CPBP family intramembrane glutamic endopeptidase [unclassified Pseudomonas]MBJ9978516.1 CPBP family intramembrane metalloprotease [Pseudomonas sp. S30]MBK0156512.1 CPBP family intramembrane metalloprotease [Pseudomonas sp. S75]
MAVVYYLIIFSMLPFGGGKWQPILLACMAVSLGMIVFRLRGGTGSLLAWFVLVAAISRLDFLFLPWPAPLIVPVAFYIYMNRRHRWGIVTKWCPEAQEWRLGIIGYSVLGACSATLGLFIWYSLASPDLSRFAAMIPHLSWWMIIPAGLAFYCVNAAVEEWAFREILFKELSSTGFSISLVVLLQAISFGCLHWQGIPGGMAGVLLSGVYGVVQGWIRWRSGGLLAPWFSHVGADLVIFSLVLRGLA